MTLSADSEISRVGGRWEAISIEDALTEHSGSVFRCPDCHGAVRPFKKFFTGTRAHFEHVEKFEKCRRSRNSLRPFDGWHPSAIE
jgi:hypothetical protein